MTQPCNHTRAVAEFLNSLTYEQLPTDVIEKAKGTLLDFIGVTLAATRRRHVQEAVNLAQTLGGNERSTVIGTPLRTSEDRAAFINGLAGSSAPNLDDASKESLGHPGVGTHPAVLAVGESRRSTGTDLIVAIVCGYELAMRIGSAVGVNAYNRGWHPRGGCNVFAAAGAALKLTGASNPETYCAALGLAGNKASGLISAAYFHDAWYTLSGNASQDGVLAALLAERGYSAGCSVLADDTYGGYCQLVAEEPDLERITDDLGSRFELMSVYQKRHASSATTHAAIDATLAILDETGLQYEEISQIDVEGYRLLVDRVSQPFPSSILHASISLPFLLAVAVKEREIGIDQLDEQVLVDSEINRLQKLVNIRTADDINRMFPRYLAARVTIRTLSGDKYSQTVITPKGDSENPMTKEDLVTKFHKLTANLLDRSAAEEVVHLIDRLETLPDIHDVIRRLQVGEPTSVSQTTTSP